MLVATHALYARIGTYIHKNIPTYLPTYITLHYITLHYDALRCVTLRYITLHTYITYIAYIPYIIYFSRFPRSRVQISAFASEDKSEFLTRLCRVVTHILAPTETENSRGQPVPRVLVPFIRADHYCR